MSAQSQNGGCFDLPRLNWLVLASVASNLTVNGDMDGDVDVDIGRLMRSVVEIVFSN